MKCSVFIKIIQQNYPDYSILSLGQTTARCILFFFQAPDMIFIPSLDIGIADGFYDLIDGLVGDIYKQASGIERLAKHSGQPHYQVLMNSLLCISWLGVIDKIDLRAL